MGEFSAEWLALREPFDHAARSVEILEKLQERLQEGFEGLELACGTGSGVRWMKRYLPAGRWTLVDRDQALLQQISPTLGATLLHDLDDLEGLPNKVDLVSCQALLDLMSEPWLVRFADWLHQHQLPLLASLSVDGRLMWRPSRPIDQKIHAAFRAHQTADRGFGPNPGPDAGRILSELLEERNYTVQVERADWEIPASSSLMIREMIQGVADAASEMIGEEAVADWKQLQMEASSSQSLGLYVGHVDLCAIPG